MNSDKVYDAVITGGGLAGLALAIQLADRGFATVLVEKEQYPFHRVCGEYISRESWNFLLSLGVDLPGFQLPQISRLELSTSKGRRLEQSLPLGGFGMSRHLLDHTLAAIARAKGVHLLENTKTTSVGFDGRVYRTVTSGGEFISRIACGSFGKRSNIDVSWQRPFISEPPNPLNNFIGVKYHVRGDFKNDTVYLHLFEKGYVGLVKIEADLYNLCYLGPASHLKRCGNSIERMEAEVLSRNPVIRELFARADKTDTRPVTISQISFESKAAVEHEVLMMGDAAGMITPLCGNGMSMALHSSKIAAGLVSSFLDGGTSRAQLASQYATAWSKEFSSRMRMGRGMQRLLAVPWMASVLVGAGSFAPGLLRQLIRRTHGRPF